MSKQQEKTPLAPDLELDQDLGFLRRMWTAQRIAWVIFALLLLAGALGLLGHGPLANASASGEDGVVLEYERFTHRATATTLRITPGSRISEEGTVDVAFNQHYIQNLTIERIIPEPDSENMAGDQIIYSFKLDEQQGNPSEIVFHAQPVSAGQWAGEVTISDGAPIQFNQIVYP